MSATPAQLSRRQWLIGSWRSVTPATPAEAPPEVRAIIQGRLCLAYRNLTCTVCLERCTVQGAISLASGAPQVVPSLCTGCGDCAAVCPAPVNAILLCPVARQGAP